MPRNNFRGMRPDVVNLLREMGVKLLRWPGGNFAGEYNWKDGLLPVDMRAPLESYMGLETQPHSLGYDFNEINTDDFVALCKRLEQNLLSLLIQLGTQKKNVPSGLNTVMEMQIRNMVE